MHDGLVGMSSSNPGVGGLDRFASTLRSGDPTRKHHNEGHHTEPKKSKAAGNRKTGHGHGLSGHGHGYSHGLGHGITNEYLDNLDHWGDESEILNDLNVTAETIGDVMDGARR